MKFGKETALQICNQHLPFLDLEYIEYGDRDDLSVQYSNDQIYEKWDVLAIKDQDEMTLLLAIDNGEVGVKVYLDSIAYNSTEVSDEYMGEIALVPITEFTESTYEKILNDIE
jgi:hypothetical protein